MLFVCLPVTRDRDGDGPDAVGRHGGGARGLRGCGGLRVRRRQRVLPRGRRGEELRGRPRLRRRGAQRPRPPTTGDRGGGAKGR